MAKIPKMRVPTHIKSNTVRIKKQANSTLYVVTQKVEVLPLKLSQVLLIIQSHSKGANRWKSTNSGTKHSPIKDTVLPRGQISRQKSLCLNKVMAILSKVKSKMAGESVVRDV